MNFTAARPKELFGDVWKILTQVRSDIGGFYLNHEDESAEIDDNAMRLMGFALKPGHKVLGERIEMIEKNKDEGELGIRLFIANENETAGFIYKKDVGETTYKDEKRLKNTRSSIPSWPKTFSLIISSR